MILRMQRIKALVVRSIHSEHEEDSVPEQGNNNNTACHGALMVSMEEQEETYRDIFQDVNVTHRYAYCAPGDTRRNYAMVHEPDYNCMTPRYVQYPLDDSTPLIDDERNFRPHCF